MYPPRIHRYISNYAVTTHISNSSHSIFFPIKTQPNFSNKTTFLPSLLHNVDFNTAPAMNFCGVFFTVTIFWVYVYVCAGQRTICGSLFSTSMWALETEVKPCGLGARTFTAAPAHGPLPRLTGRCPGSRAAAVNFWTQQLGGLLPYSLPVLTFADTAIPSHSLLLPFLLSFHFVHPWPTFPKAPVLVFHHDSKAQELPLSFQWWWWKYLQPLFAQVPSFHTASSLDLY